MAPVCWSSSRPLGVAAKFSRLSNNVSSQMSLFQHQRETERDRVSEPLPNASGLRETNKPLEVNLLHKRAAGLTDG